MGTVPTYPTVATLEDATSAKMNQIRDAGAFGQNPPQCLAYRNAALTLTTATWTAVGLDAEVFDVPYLSGDAPLHDNVTANTKVFARTAGKYEITGATAYASNATGVRSMNISLNANSVQGAGTPLIQTQQTPVTGLSTPVPAGVTLVYPMAAGDYVELFAFQNSGGNLAMNTGLINTFLRIRWVGV